MKVKQVSVIRVAHPWKTRIYVVVTTEDGRQGIGEATIGQLSHGVVGAVRDIEPVVVGLNVHDIGILRNKVLRDIYADGGQIVSAALAGVEMALWDIIAKAADLPLFKLLGGRVQPRLRLYANGWYRGKRDPEVISQLAKQVVAQGYTALKIDPFGGNWRTISRREIDLSVQILRGVRAAIGEDVDLIVEGHSRFDSGAACSIAKRIEPLNPLWFEEPLRYSDISGYKDVVSKTSVPIAAGESLWTIDQFGELLNAAKISIVQFDPIHVGGIMAARVISEMALARNAMIAPHSASGPVNELVCAHIATASPHLLVFERFHDLESDDSSASLFQSSFRVADGFGEVEERPGIGAQFSLSHLLAHHTELDTKDQNVFEPGWELRKTR
ncbi:MAG: mandelate racemase/muconate lactonizing enzyme family protein [Ignavibacteria bacterium]|nr:mandelate racemase/muconate lactonizing enzyme family protein [Ignavibacteria bacterium]